MISNENAGQASPGCCDAENDSFDCAAMMEKFKDCCDSAKEDEHTGCCPDALPACCESTEAAEN